MKNIISILSVSILLALAVSTAQAGGGPHEPGCPIKVVEGKRCSSASGNIRFTLVTEQLQNTSCQVLSKWGRTVEVSTSGQGGTLQDSAIVIFRDTASTFTPVGQGTQFDFDGNAILQPQKIQILFSSSEAGQIGLGYGLEAQKLGGSPFLSEEFFCAQ